MGEEASIWPDITPSEFIRRQGELQRQINEVAASIEARKADIRRVGAVSNAKARAFEEELAKQDQRLASLENAFLMAGSDEHLTQQFSKFGVVTLTPEQRSVFSKEISDKVFERQQEERKKLRTRTFDKTWVRISAAITLIFLAYPALVGGTPLLPAILRFFHVIH